MAISSFPNLDQGSDEWLAARCGLITASEMKLAITPTLKPAANEKTRAHAFELAAQRVTRHVEPSYVSDDMLRGREDEVLARAAYAEHFAPVQDMGFITNDRWGFTIGFSPDALVGDDGIIEIKSRRQRFQVETIIGEAMPAEYLLQVQTGLLVSERSWCDFISYSGGLPMAVIRVEADPHTQAKIVEAASAFEQQVVDLVADYSAALTRMPKLIPTERTVEVEIYA